MKSSVSCNRNVFGFLRKSLNLASTDINNNPCNPTLWLVIISQLQFISCNYKVLLYLFLSFSISFSVSMTSQTIIDLGASNLNLL